jgi:hypothetical protein
MADYKNKSLILRRADITKNFTIIPNYIPQSKTLSADAIYLLVLVLSKPVDWYYVKTQFWRETQLGRMRFNKAWKELEIAGYIKSEKIMNGNLICGYNYIISDSPIFGYTDNDTNRKVVDNQRTELQSTEEQRKDIQITESVYTGGSEHDKLLSEYLRNQFASLNKL